MFRKFKKYLLVIAFGIQTPFAWLYGVVIMIRNFLYTYNIQKSYVSNAHMISVGNIATGGTGKTPCIEYLVRLLQQDFYTIVISRGYKRRTRGYRIASSVDNAWTIGDEPYQLYRKFVSKQSKTQVVVAENRAKAIQNLIINYPNTQIILLDDGFQHRRVERQLNILLTTFHKPFFTDYLLPAGRLREPRSTASRADAILVTKCPPLLSYTIRTLFKQCIAQYCTNKNIPILFTCIRYGIPVSLWPTHTDNFADHVVLVTGIADSAPLVDYVRENYQLVKHITFNDHHTFTQRDVRKIVLTFHQVTYKKKCILTTEKDSMRLMKPDLVPILRQIPIFLLPISMEFIEGERSFIELVWNSIKK